MHAFTVLQRIHTHTHKHTHTTHHPHTHAHTHIVFSNILFCPKQHISGAIFAIESSCSVVQNWSGNSTLQTSSYRLSENHPSHCLKNVALPEVLLCIKWLIADNSLACLSLCLHASRFSLCVESPAAGRNKSWESPESSR